MKVIIKQIELKKDDRGCIFEPLDPANIFLQRNIHVVLTQPGCVRGNHYHKHGTEVITVFGSTLVRFHDQQTIKDVTVSENQAVRFDIPQGVSHAFKNTGSKTTVMIAFNTVVHDQEDPDIIGDALIES
jgi:UDP-2-acetamido-2,6-beta-L-arabino-hexul-4-ose reductase